MGPGEAIAVLSLFIGLPWVVFSGIAKIKAAGSSARSSDRGSEIRKSELEALIETAVEDATAPLVRRVEVLEAILTEDDAAMDRIDPAVLAGVIEPSADEEDWSPGARRMRV